MTAPYITSLLTFSSSAGIVVEKSRIELSYTEAKVVGLLFADLWKRLVQFVFTSFTERF